jgi:hypothetical protein
VRLSTTPGVCTDRAVAELATPYCFGDATEGEARRFELHLMECDACWAEVQRLEAAVRVLRSDMTLAHTLTVQEIAGLLGMSAGLERRFSGHWRFVLAAGAVAASLFAVPVLVELAYEWERYQFVALLAAPAVFTAMFATMVFAMAVDVRRAREGRGGLGRALVVLASATALLCLALWPWFENAPVVRASFQTYPLHLSYMKAMIHAWAVVPVFVFWPLHAVVALQRELAEGRHRGVAALLGGRATALPPRGLRYPRVWALAAYLVVVFVYHWAGTSHLFDNLTPNRHASLFMALVILRNGLLLGLPLMCMWWYAGCLDELRREAAAVLAFIAEPGRGEPRS